MRTAAFAAVLVAAAVSHGQTTPMTPLVKPGEQQPEVKPAPKKDMPKVYDESADGARQIEAAIAKANKHNRRVLIQWGANWCGWCIKLHNTCTTDKDIKKQLSYEYDVVHVDIGRADKNLELVKKYGATLKEGVPYLTVLDADGKPVANQETGSLEKGSVHDPEKVLAFLKQHEAPKVGAEELLTGALARAKKENKLVFLHFGAPWCGWCHKLEDWMARPDIAAILAKDFVDLKIDEDRNPGAAEVQKKYPKRGGIPWFAFLDSDGKVVADSNGEKGNIGFPAKADEVAHFVGMLRKAKRNISDAEVEVLGASLEPKKKD
ncbi:MAG TPA: thioredoxin family protein [Phycisphaerales bacterium]|nr:thioredoxin family protein [Phycisphaerales bacterium]